MPNIPSLSEGEISQIKCNDVICRQGNFAFCHPGNIYFRSIVSRNKLEYVVGNSLKKLSIANIIVNNIQSLVPSGRFLKKAKGSTKSSEKEAWQDIGEEAKIAKTRHALRIGANEIEQTKLNISSEMPWQQNAMRGVFAKTQFSMNEVSILSLSTHQHY